MDKKSFDIVLDEIRKCVLTDQRIKAIELVHGYFSSEQVTEMLKYFSYAEPQIKAVKAMQHKMVAIPTTKVVNILNCFTFSKDKLIVLELIALNISDAQNSQPVEELFRFHHSEKKRCRRILEQVRKVGCKAPVAMISSCGMIPGNPYPKGRPSQVTGTFPGMPARKEGEELGSEGKGIAARILGPFKPSPASYNPHRPVPYPIPPCRPHATIAPSRSNNVGLMPVGGVITATVPPPPYRATPNATAFSRPTSQQNPTPGTSGTPTPSPHGSNPPTPSTPHPPNPSSAQAPPTTPITPVFPGLVPSQNTAAASPSLSPASSVIKGPPLSVGSNHTTPTPTPSGLSTPVNQSFPGISPSATPTPSVIKSHTPSATPCGTPGPSGGYSPSPFGGMSRSGTPSGHPTAPPTPTSRSGMDLSPSPVGSVGQPSFKGYQLSEAQSGSPFPGLPTLVTNSAQSVIRSYTPSAPAAPAPTPTPKQTQGHSTSGLPAFSSMPPGSASADPSPKPSGVAPLANSAAFYGEQHLSILPSHCSSGNSGSNSPVPSAFKGPSRSATPSLSSLVMPNSATVVRSLNMSRSAGSPQASLPSPVAMAGLQGLSAALSSQSGGSPAPHSLAVPTFPGLSPFSSLQPSSPFTSTPPSSAPSSSSSTAPAVSVAVAPPPSSAYSSLPHSTAPTTAPFGLGLTTTPSMFPGPNSGFPGFGNSGPQAAGSPVLSPFMGLPGSAASVATVAPLPAAAVAGVPSSAPVLPRFASAFSSNFNPALVPPAGLTSGLQTPGGAAAFPGLLSFPAVPGFSPSTSPAALSGLHNPAVQSALLQAHSASALESFPPQPNGFTNYPPAPGTPFSLQPGLHPQLGWQ